jgi:hypothetical protein
VISGSGRSTTFDYVLRHASEPPLPTRTSRLVAETPRPTSSALSAPLSAKAIRSLTTCGALK